MNAAIHELAKDIFDKPLEDCTIEELQAVTDQYPYFGPAHLLLTQKLADAPGQQEAYARQLEKTSLYFPNRVWLDHLLNNGKTRKQDQLSPDHEASPEPSAQQEHKAAIETLSEMTTISEPEAIPVIEAGAIESVVEPELKVEIEAPAEVSLTPETDAIPIMESPAERDPGPVEIVVEAAAITTEEPELNVEIEKPSEWSAAPEPEKELLFEPYHTVDYFASQGIRFKEEEKPKDRFSSQLKSFTEWLKTLKKTPSEMTTSTDANAEKKVEHMAEVSIAERHVVTEAMAEVWRKQGNRAKAEEIYRKLSLLEPSKSSYFAAKIEELKKTS